MSAPHVFSVGYGGRPGSKDREPGSLDTPEQLHALVQRLDVVLWDVRASPGPASEADITRTGKTIRWKSGRLVYVRRGFLRMDLQAALGNRYHYAGAGLGGPGGGAVGPTAHGMEKLEAAAIAGKRILLMCSEATPAGCHRFHQIATPGSMWTPALPAPLSTRGIDVQNIFFDNGPDGMVMGSKDLTAYLARIAKGGKNTEFKARPLSDFYPKPKKGA